MKKHEMLLTAALLDWAHEIFINHTPGPIPDTIRNILTPSQWGDLSREYHQFLSRDYHEPLEKGFDPDRPTASLYDDAALWVLSKKIKKEADMMPEGEDRT